MGDFLDYERGKLCIGRKIKLVGNRGKHGWNVGVLKAAFPKQAQVRPAGHGRDEMVPWSEVIDWPSGNGSPAPHPERPPKPLPVIRRMPELTALEHKELKAMQTPKPTTVPVPSAVAALRGAVDSADLSDLGGLAERIETARKNLAAARQLRAEAEAEEAAAVKVFDDLRATAKKALAMIDAAAGGAA